MTEFRDRLEKAITDDGDVVALVNGAEELADLAALRARAPDADPAALAAVVNEFAQGRAFRVIEDPDAYKGEYLAQVENEDAGAIWTEGTVRLRDFGVPDFGEITAPSVTGTTLTFCVADRYTGLPYRVEASLSPGGPDPAYAPLDLAPVPGPKPEVPAEVTEAALGPIRDPEPKAEEPPRD